MLSRSRLRLASFLLLFLLAVAGTFLVLRATPEGLGLSDDSIAYIAGARSLLMGDGYREIWLASSQPVTHFPPGFSSVLAFIGMFGLDPLRGARLLNALLFGLNAGVLGILAWRMTRSLTAGLILAALFVLNGDLLQIHAVAMSEPLFIFFSLLAFWMFDLHFESQAFYAAQPVSDKDGRIKRWRRKNESAFWLVMCGAFTGMAYLTRYSGLALVATFLVAIFLFHTEWRKRFTNSLLFLAGFVPWAAAWSVRNMLVAENATNRSLAWHPVTAENLRLGFRVFADFLLPVTAWYKALVKQPYVFEVLTLIVLGSVLAWTVLQSWKCFSKPNQASVERRGGLVIPLITGLYLFAYLASTIASMSLFDAATKFKPRIVSPLFVCLLILAVYAGSWLSKKNLRLTLVLAVVLLGLSLNKQINTVNTWARSGLGYASFQWYDAPALTFVRDLPGDVLIFTNEPGAVYLYTGRGAVVLPSAYDSARAEAVPGFEDGVTHMQAEINAGRAVLVIFDNGTNIQGDLEALTADLHLAHKSQGDAVYTKP